MCNADILTSINFSHLTFNRNADWLINNKLMERVKVVLLMCKLCSFTPQSDFALITFAKVCFYIVKFGPDKCSDGFPLH